MYRNTAKRGTGNIVKIWDGCGFKDIYDNLIENNCFIDNNRS